MRFKPQAFTALALLLSSTVHAAPESAQSTAAAALARLKSNAGGQLLHSAQADVAYNLVRASGAQLLSADNSSLPPLERALNFLSLNGLAVGVSDPLQQLALQRLSTDRAGNRHVHLQQMHKGLPVFGARLVVHMSDRGIYGVSGVFVPGLEQLVDAPALDVAVLRANALGIAAKQHPGATLAIESTRFMYYRGGLLSGRPGPAQLAYEAMVSNPGVSIRERVILSAANGGLINRIDEIHTLLNREIYTPDISSPPAFTEGTPLVLSEPPLTGDGPSSPASRAPRNPLENLYIFAGGTYTMYKNFFGHEGYDQGARSPEEQVQKSVYYVQPFPQCPNATWNGTSTNYCPGFDADDVVSHEWSHAYTEYTHGLIYQWQSGALNEAYSDIFGETYDLVNGIEGPLGANLTEGEYYENGGSRWVVGEDLSEPVSLAILRDMWDPDSFGKLPGTDTNVLNGPSPGSVITSPNYYCGTSQGTVVHTNSGVPNHAYAMLVDGKEYNGVNIPKIGLVKAAHIYYHAETHYQTPTTNFSQHADALEQSCADLAGAPLNDALGNVSGEVIGPADCAAVQAAIAAVEFRLSDKERCGFVPLLNPEAGTPQACPSGKFDTPDFVEDWESGDTLPAGWTVVNNFTGDAPAEKHPAWSLVDAPAPHTGRAAFIPNPGSGGGVGSGNDLSGSSALESPELTVTADQSYFRFTHQIASEQDFDGGNLKYSVNGGEFALVPVEALSYNPYNGTLDEGAAASPLPVPLPADPLGLTGGGNTNPMGGQPAFTGSDQGESSSGWGTTHVDLAALGVKAGDKLRLRFEFGQDYTSGNVGWAVDEVALLHCGDTAPPAKAGAAPGRFGGAPGALLLLPLLGAALRRRRGGA